ncbi:MAG TPA: TetR/AcrR family transcriptional regulator [Patescibacteria group bacterium]|nr:TetR/AcrR family transcriptional regulator [Patescibacteria group bacterium]
MSPGRPREFNFDDALTRALHVFWAKGYEGTSLPDLTAAMGINRPSLYATFGNKEELFRKALDKYAAESKKRLDETLAAPTAYEAVEKFIYGVADGTACPKSPKGCLMVQGALSCGEEAKPIQEELARRRQLTETALRRRIEKGIAEGDVPPSVSAADLARFYATVVQGMAVQSTASVTADDMRGIADWALKAFPRK